MPSLEQLGLGILLPAVLCGILLLVLRGKDALVGVAIGVPWAFSFHGFYGRFPFWPWEDRTLPASDWLVWIVLLAAILSAIRSRFLGVVLRVGLSSALVWLTLARWAERKGAWTTLLVCFLALLAVWTFTDAWVARARSPRAPLALAVAATAASLANLLSRSALLGGLAGALSACLVAAACLVAIRREVRLTPGAVAIVLLVLGGTLIQGGAFAKLPWTSALLVAGSVLAPGLLELRREPRPESWKLTLLACLLAAVPGALAVWNAWIPDAGEPY